MTTDDILKIVFGAVILGFALISKMVKSKRAPQSVAPPVSQAPAAPAAAVPNQRVLALLAEMRRRGITPPPALQALAAQAAQAAAAASGPPAYAATAAYTAQPAYAAPQAQTKHRHQRGERPPDRPRVAVPATPLSVLPTPGVFAPAPAPRGSTGRMLARAFGDPASARNAVILAEVLKPPVALR